MIADEPSARACWRTRTPRRGWGIKRNMEHRAHESIGNLPIVKKLR